MNKTLCRREGKNYKFNSALPIAEIKSSWDVNPLMPSPAICEKNKVGAEKFRDLFSTWFFSGLSKLEIDWKPDVIGEHAMKHLKVCMSSWACPHEDKEDACCVLMSNFAKTVTYASAEGDKKEITINNE